MKQFNNVTIIALILPCWEILGYAQIHSIGFRMTNAGYRSSSPLTEEIASGTMNMEYSHDHPENHP